MKFNKMNLLMANLLISTACSANIDSGVGNKSEDSVTCTLTVLEGETTGCTDNQHRECRVSGSQFCVCTRDDLGDEAQTIDQVRGSETDIARDAGEHSGYYCTTVWRPGHGN